MADITTAKALDAIRAVYSDMSVPQSETKSRLEELRDEIDQMLTTLSDE